MDAGERIKRLRVSAGYTVSELARRAGLSQGYLSQIEMGRARPSVRALAKTAQALAVPLTSLLSESDHALLAASASAPVASMETVDPEDQVIMRSLSKLNRQGKQALIMVIRGILHATSDDSDDSTYL